MYILLDMTNATAARLTDRINAEASAHHVGGEDYIVTTGTGERGYGRDGGGACAFLYLASEVTAWLDSTEQSEPSEHGWYTDFCDAITPETDRELAIYLAARGMRLTQAGACTPILTDDEFALVQAAIAVAP